MAASEQLRSKSEQLATISEQLRDASEQLEQKSKQLRSVSKHKIGMVYQQMYFVLLNSHIFGDNCCACRARHGARPTAPGHQATSIGAKESERADKLAEELKGEYLLVRVTVEVVSLYDGTL